MSGSEGSAILVAPGGLVRWGLAAEAIRSVLHPREVRGRGAVIDVSRRLSLDPPADGPRRLIAVTGAGGETLLVASGQLEVLELAPDATWPLPRLLAAAALRAGVRGIAFTDEGPPVLVLDPDALANGDG